MEVQMIRGNFIVFEGIDGSGTTTQAAKLGSKFTELGMPSHVTAEPSGGPVGSLIRQVLSGRLIVPSRGATASPSWKSMSLLFAADRQDHVESEIAPNLRDGVNVICDRYVYSSVIYQSVSSGNDNTAKWIEEINKYAQKPDMVLFLRVSAAEAYKRRSIRNQNVELYEQPEFQAQLADVYNKLPKMFPDVDIVVIDGSQSVDQISKECWSHIERLRAAGAPE
jgi:dTMP kinase